MQGETLNERQLQSIKAEDDSATVTLDGQTFSIEQAAGQPYYVNALLYPGEPHWGSPIGSLLNVTYSFLTQVPGYYASNADERNNFRAIDQYQPNGTLRTAVGRALDYWSSVANITFTPINGIGTITFGTASLGPAKSAHAYNPGQGNYGGDVWLNNTQNSNLTQTPGSFGFTTLLHEIGHALGLKHPGNYNAGGNGADPPYLSLAEDNNTNTIMTYNDVGSYAASPMPYDIAALQYLYGPSFYYSTSTTYSFSSVHSYRVNGNSQDFGSTTTPTKLTIWDSGGSTDTLDFSALSSNISGYRFDLNQGGINTTQSAYNGSPYTAYGDTSGTTYRTSTIGTVIAFNTVIEDLIGSSSNDRIHGNDARNSLMGGFGDDTLSGGSGNDNLQGGDGNNYLYGEFGDDFFIGGNQTDYIDGGQDNDSIYAVGGDDVLLGDSGIDSLHGGEGNDFLFGGTENDYLFGGSATVTLSNTGNDDLNGGAGNDVMNGQDGNDSYSVDNLLDSIIEDSSTGGTDTVYSTINWTLGTNLENLKLKGTDAIEGYGNELNNAITGNAANNTLDGATGVDALTGGLGDDTYIVDNALDVGIENAGEGTDTYRSSASSFQMDADVENLIMLSGAISATGTGIANTMTGNSAKNTLDGGVGNDTILGGGGIDTLIGGTGDDSLTGGADNDTLDGGTGSDTMSGQDGDDLYKVENPLDSVIEEFNGGIDSINVAITYKLGANVEHLNLVGKTAINGTGNISSNTLTGNGASNSLNGDAGNDTILGGGGIDTLIGGTGDDSLTGGAGADRLTGGTGKDRFVFTAKTEGKDTITDFSVVDDTINVSKLGFGGGLTTGAAITAAQFRLGTAAGDTSDRFVYNKANGALLFDTDGTGASTSMQFAQLSTGLALTNNDIFVFA